MVFFNDPMPCDDAGLRAIRMAVAMRTRVRELADVWSRRGHDLGFGVGIAQGYATLGPHRVRGPLRLRRDRQRRQPRRPAVRGGAAVADPRHPAGARRRRGARRQHAGRGARAGRLQPARAGVRHQGHRHGADRAVSAHRRRRPARRGTVDLSDLDEAAAVPDLRSAPAQPAGGLGRDAPEPRERVGGRDPVGDARSTRRPQRQLTQAYEERFLFLLLLLREPRLRMIYVTSTPIAPAIVEYYLALLPGVIPSHARARLTLVSVGDGTPRPLSEKLLERPRLLRRIAALIPDPVAVPSHPVQHDRARAGHRGGARDPDVRRRSPTGAPRDQDRLPPAVRRGGGPPPARVEDLHTLDEVADAVVSMRRAADDDGRRDRQAQRGRLRSGQRAGRPARPAASRRRGRAHRDHGAPAGDAVRAPGHAARRLPGQARRTRRDRRGAHRRRRDAQPERAAARHAAAATSSCCRRTTSCSAGRAGRATSAAGSRPTSPTRRRSAPRRRSSVPAWPVKA